MDLAAIRGACGDRLAAREYMAAALSIFVRADAPKRAATAHVLAQSLDLELDDVSRIRPPRLGDETR